MSTFTRLCRFVVLFSITACTVQAQQTIRVPGPFSTIQDAINSAQTGDTILVGPGTYFENLTIDTKQITLISTDGPATTTLDGSHLGPVVKIANTPGIATVISGFTVQNGSPLGSAPGSTSVGPAGILIASAGAQITNSTFQKNAGINLGVINGSLTLTASSLSTASTAGGSCGLSSGTTPANPSTGVYLSGTSTVLTNTGAPIPSVVSGNMIFGDGTRCSGLGVQAINLGQALTLQNNTIRNNSLGIAAQAPQMLVIQNLVYDNVTGGLSLNAPSAPPNVEPITTFVINNTVVNNLTSTDPSAVQTPTDIFLDGTVSRTAFVNNILVGTTPHPVLTCATATPSINDVPLVFDHNDLYNTTNAPNGTLTGDCLTLIGGSPNSAPGNLSVDPRLTGSTDLHPLAGSPVIDAGNNSAPGLLFDAFSLASGSVTTHSPLLTDIAGNRRIADATGHGSPVVDMGAYEANGSLLLIPTASVVFAAPSTTLPGFTALSGYTIAASGVHPAGTITFLDNGALYGPQIPGPDNIAHGEISTFGQGVYNFQARSNLSDPAFAPSTSIVIYILVIDFTTTLSITPSSGPQLTTQPLKLTVHLGSLASDSTSPGPTPPGVVYLDQDGSLLSTLQPDSTGLATFTLSHPPVGSHTYSVIYEGDGAYTYATATTNVTITAPIATTLTAAATPNPAPLNSPVACTAHVLAASGPAPTGTVNFTDGATPEGTVALTSPGEQGIATVNLGPLSLGLHTLTVTFQPDPGFSPSVGTCTVNVGGDATTTSLGSSKNPASTTDTVTYTVTVARSGAATNPAAPTGSVTLSEGNTLLATAPLVTGSASSSTAALPVVLSSAGLHILTTVYIPATSATFTSSDTLSETITAPAAIATVLSATPNPATVGQPITLSASLTSQAPLPNSATLTFIDGATVLGSAPVSAAGTATLPPVSTLSLGAHQLSAVLRTAGSSVIRSTSNLVNVQVNGLATTLTLAAAPGSALATAPVTLTASLATTPALPSGTMLGGTVIFLDGNQPLGTATLSADGHATFLTSALATGTHTLSASFAGSDLLAAALSASITESIASNPTSTALSVTPAVSAAFAPVTLTAHISSATSSTRINTLACPPICNPIAVTFSADSPTGHLTLGTVAVDIAGNATLVITPAAGTYSVSAAFSGSTLFAASASTVSSLAVTPAATALTLTANPNPVYQHGNVTLTAALTAPGIPASALTGTVTFLEGSTTLATTSLAAAQSFSYAPGSVGSHTLTAVFSGTTSLSGASATATITVLPSDFVLSLKDPTLTIATTHHAPTTITINTTGALADLIDLSCANLPQNAHCTFSPATHDLTASNTSTGTLTLDTDALLNYARLDASPVTPKSNPGSSGGFTTLLALSLPPSLLAALACLRRRRHPGRPALPHLLAMFFLAITALTLSGCSGLYPSHVTPGTYTVTITGHARSTGVQHSTTLTLVVTP